MLKVFIGVGHGGSDPGAVGYVVEKDVNLKMAKACRDYLQSAGVQTLISRENDVDDGLMAKIKRCNSYNPDYALDIHNNAGNGDGFEVYHSVAGGKGKTLALNIEAEVKKIGQNSRGLRTKANSAGNDYFGFIREVNCPSIICEGAFVDNEEDAAQIDTDTECKAFGIAYAKGILKTLGNNYVPTTDTNSNIIVNCNMHVKDLQYALNEDGIKDGRGIRLEEDGIYGTNTEAAVKKICLSTKTRGRYTNTTSWVQCRVGASVDGIFGDATTKKVKEYQVKKKLTSDGIVGFNTMKALLKDCDVNV